MHTGCGGEPWANANLVQRVREVSSDGSEAGAYTVTLTEQQGGGGGMTIIDETTTTSVTVVGPSGERETRTLSQRRVQHTPSVTGGCWPCSVRWQEEH